MDEFKDLNLLDDKKKPSYKIFIMDNTFPVGSCPTCKEEFHDWDKYLEHLVEEKRKDTQANLRQNEIRTENECQRAKRDTC